MKPLSLLQRACHIESMRRLAFGAIAVLVLMFVVGAVLLWVLPTTPAPPLRPAALPPSAWSGVNFAAAGDEALLALQRYVQAKSTAAEGEQHAAQVMQTFLADGGVSSTLWPISTDARAATRVSLFARLPATHPSGEGALCLVSHIDTVDAEATQWRHPPFAGDIVDEAGERVLYGRGALDMKGIGIVHAEVMRLLQQHQVPRQRDVVLLAVADEEGDSLGMKHVLRAHGAELGCSHAINEGGLTLKDALLPGQAVAGISVGERGFLWLLLVADGPPGHGSTPNAQRAPGRLLQAMARIETRRPTVSVHPALYALLAAAGRQQGGFLELLMTRPALVDRFVVPRMMREPAGASLLTDTVQLTGLGGASSPNVVPGRVWAQYDIRLLPGRTKDEMIEELKGLIGDIEGISFSVLGGQQAAASVWEGDALYDAIATHAGRGLDDVVVAPTLSPGFTDSIFLREHGVHAYGFVPFVLDLKQVQTMHGNDEHLSDKNLRRAIEVMFYIATDFAGIKQ